MTVILFHLVSATLRSVHSLTVTYLAPLSVIPYGHSLRVANVVSEEKGKGTDGRMSGTGTRSDEAHFVSLSFRLIRSSLRSSFSRVTP